MASVWNVRNILAAVLPICLPKCQRERVILWLPFFTRFNGKEITHNRSRHDDSGIDRSLDDMFDQEFTRVSWWRHQMETFSALLVTGEFPTQRPVTWSFDVFLICSWINGWVNTRGVGDLRHQSAHYDVTAMMAQIIMVINLHGTSSWWSNWSEFFMHVPSLM